MSSTEPVVCLVFKLPPELEIYLTLKSLLDEISQKLGHLTLVIIGYSKTHPFSEAVQHLKNTRAAAAAGAMTHHLLTIGLVQTAVLYLKLLNEVSPTFARSRERPLRFREFTDNVEMSIDEHQTAYTRMTELIEEATEAVEKIRSLVESSNSDDLLLTQENVEVVNNLIRAAKKSASKLKDGKKYFQELNQHLYEVEAKAKASPPLIREAEMVRKKWSNFHVESLVLVSGAADVEFSLHSQASFMPRGVTVDVARRRRSKSTPIGRRIYSFVARLFS